MQFTRVDGSQKN